MAAPGVREGTKVGRHDRRHRHRHPGPLRVHRSPRHHRRPAAAAHHPWPAPAYAARLFDAHAAGAAEQQLQDIVAEGLQEIYFKDRGRRAHGLLVDLTDIDYLDVDY